MPNNQNIVIVDYGMGNLRSVYNKFRQLKTSVVISSKPEVVLRADKLILPGVGHFAHGMKNLKAFGLVDCIQEKVIYQKVPILGICLGMQLFTSYSEEGNTQGLGWIDAQTLRFKISDTKKWKVPHMGWNTLAIKKNSAILNHINANSMYYFVHSYHVDCNDANDVLTTSIYDYEFVSAIQKENIFGVQFHPEKSHDNGMVLLENFVKL
jgi:glutamine amidotransferase